MKPPMCWWSVPPIMLNWGIVYYCFANSMISMPKLISHNISLLMTILGVFPILRYIQICCNECEERCNSVEMSVHRDDLPFLTSKLECHLNHYLRVSDSDGELFAMMIHCLSTCNDNFPCFFARRCTSRTSPYVSFQTILYQQSQSKS